MVGSLQFLYRFRLTAAIYDKIGLVIAIKSYCIAIVVHIPDANLTSSSHCDRCDYVQTSRSLIQQIRVNHIAEIMHVYVTDTTGAVMLCWKHDLEL